MRSLILLLGPLSRLIRPSLCYRHFQSRNVVAQSIMENCTATTPDERANCYDIVRCILQQIPSDFPPRWSAGSSILAFVPTIVGLMSNSITEIIIVAETSTLLAIPLCFCSVTSFSSRFTHEHINEIHVSHDPPTAGLQAAWEDMKMMIQKRNSDSNRWNNTKVQDAGLSLTLAALSGGVWYEVYQISRYGVITFACPVKINIGVWVALSQTVTLLNCLGREILYDHRKIHFRWTSRQVHLASSQPSTSPSNAPSRRLVIILRSRRSSLMARSLRSFTAVVSYALYIFGTVILASVNFVPASDAIRALVVLSVSAAFGVLVCNWTLSPLSKGRIHVFDVPPEHLEDLSQFVHDQAVITA